MLRKPAGVSAIVIYKGGGRIDEVLSPPGHFLTRRCFENGISTVAAPEKGRRFMIAWDEVEGGQTQSPSYTTTCLRFIASESGCRPWAFKKLTVFYLQFNSCSLLFVCLFALSSITNIRIFFFDRRYLPYLDHFVKVL